MRESEIKAENQKFADEFSAVGSVKHFALRLGFMPDTEEAAEKILESIVNNEEKLQSQLDQKERMEEGLALFVKRHYSEKITQIAESKIPAPILDAMKQQGWDVFRIYELVEQELKKFRDKEK